MFLPDAGEYYAEQYLAQQARREIDPRDSLSEQPLGRSANRTLCEQFSDLVVIEFLSDLSSTKPVPNCQLTAMLA